MKFEKLINKFNNRIPGILGSETCSEFAVLLPLIEINEEVHILFEVRSLHLRRQPGEICFPGGKVDEQDKNKQYTAVRETTEELGIQESCITNVFPLDYIVTPFGTIIYPYVGTLSDSAQLKPNPSEVAEIFTVPLSFLQQVAPEIYSVQLKVEPEKAFPLHAIAGGENYNWQTGHMDEHFYYYEDKVIWGLTARILSHFLEVLDKE